MQFNLDESIKKISRAFGNLDKLPRAIIKRGTQAFLLVFAIGTLLVVLNRSAVINYNYYNDFIATSLIRTSFILFAEAVIGGLIMDFVFKKN